MTYHLDREQCGAVVNKAARRLYLYCRKSGLHYLVTGSSGGRDSAITLGIAQRACQMAEKEKYALTSVGVVLPCCSLAKFTKLGELAVKKFGAKLIRIYLTEMFYAFEDYAVFNNDGDSDLGDSGLQDQITEILRQADPSYSPDKYKWTAKICAGNIKARLRMIVLYHIARSLNSGMVMSTDNLSEKWMGFWTICGDVGDYGMIQNILKGAELEDIAVYLGVPEAILAQKPDDGLGVTKNGDAGQLGADYPEVDRIIVNLIRQGFNPDGPKSQLRNLPVINGADPQLVASLAARALNTAYKRRGPINLTRKQLGLTPIKRIKL